MEPKHLLIIVFSVFTMGTCSNFFAQEIVPKVGSYGVDKKNKIIVWNQNNLDSLTTANTILSINFGDVFKLKNPNQQLTYSKNDLVKKDENYTLYITKLPVVHLNTANSALNSSIKIGANFTYFKDNNYIESIVGVRHRGNLSLSFPKKSFDLEFWRDSITKQSKDVKFKGLKKDDDWILDGMYNEPLHLRAYIASNLWTKIYKPHYLEKEPKAKSGFEVKFVEVFKNNEYYGIYSLSESISRKLLKLKKNQGNLILGELYKADSYKGAPEFIKAPSYNNIFPHWSGFQTRYPLIDYKSDFKELSDFVSLVVNGSDEEFSKLIASKVHIKNAIDYYLFVNLLRASDNLGKNYFLGKYDKDQPYFFIPWDLDGSFGVIREGQRLTNTTDILSNGLFDRLLAVNPDNYRENLKLRWLELRSSAFSNAVLFSKIDKIYDEFTKGKLYEREQIVWKRELDKVSNENHLAYLKSWLKDRLIHLDAHFGAL